MGNLGELLGCYLLHNLKAKKTGGILISGQNWREKSAQIIKYLDDFCFLIPNIHVLSLNLDDFYVLRWEMKKMVDSTIRNPAFGMYGCSNAVLYFFKGIFCDLSFE